MKDEDKKIIKEIVDEKVVIWGMLGETLKERGVDVSEMVKIAVYHEINATATSKNILRQKKETSKDILKSKKEISDKIIKEQKKLGKSKEKAKVKGGKKKVSEQKTPTTEPALVGKASGGVIQSKTEYLVVDGQDVETVGEWFPTSNEKVEAIKTTKGILVFRHKTMGNLWFAKPKTGG